MAQRLTQQEFEVLVSYHGFGMQESDESFVSVEYPDDTEFGVFLQTFQGRLDLSSAAHTHIAPLTVEVWDGTPEPNTSQNWEETEEATLHTTSGELAVWDGTGRADADVIRLGGSGGTWQVRAMSSGRREAERVEYETGDSVSGIEKYLVQFWPAAL
ncbi:hypothetical protein I5Q34_32260 [Streptomyces sp. AV19]|uniref:hypothetical protein n=1 Tax=Streptomyces sp. AV19 TaxID=2793068 RepID=UPI0018FE6347|nr:hypothetical protein [Streptomyces sp. AV19]MBH1938880.1 hypothetical protein [Streptomyces sp. AV19]MDG4533501.1 hypothetical protein [Streptomyces sp. AV19]